MFIYETYSAPYSSKLIKTALKHQALLATKRDFIYARSSMNSVLKYLNLFQEYAMTKQKHTNISQLPSYQLHHILQHGTFEQYCQAWQQCIAENHYLRHQFDTDKLVHSNAPFEWHPPQQKTTKAVLLIHGFTDSCFGLRDVGKILVQQGYLVRSILLPGHGISPHELKKVSYKDWLQAVDYAIKNLQRETDNITLVGLSIGAAVSLWHGCNNSAVKKLILFTPALKLYSPWHYFKIQYKASKLRKKNNITDSAADNDYSRFRTFPVKSVFHIMWLCRKVRKQLRKKQPPPSLAYLSLEDETIDPKTYLHFFNASHTKDDMLIVYSKKPISFTNPQIYNRSSVFIKDNIIDFSHTCLHLSPQNIHYGKHGDFIDYNHLRIDSHSWGQPRQLGAISVENLHFSHLARLRYNPDFDQIQQDIKKFVKDIDPITSQ